MDMELPSDLCVIAGTLLVIAALWAMWRPLGLLALGLALIATGFVLHLRTRAHAADGKKAKPR